MLATPTGSTAYSVAAGGSMVHPNVQAILLTPICPHSLNFRPIILPDYVEMELRVPDSARVGAWVCFDGKQRQELQRGDSVFIKMSENPVPTINRADLTTGGPVLHYQSVNYDRVSAVSACRGGLVVRSVVCWSANGQLASSVQPG